MEYMGLLKVVNKGPEGPGTEIFFINFGGLNSWGSFGHAKGHILKA